MQYMRRYLYIDTIPWPIEYEVSLTKLRALYHILFSETGRYVNN